MQERDNRNADCESEIAMNKRQNIIVGVLVVVVVLVIALGMQFGDEEGGGIFQRGEGTPADESAKPTYEGRPLEEVYESEVPRGATVQDEDAKFVVPASPNPALDTKARRFDIKATKDGFEPDEIVVNQWDRVELDFTAVDGKYDLSIPYLGSYFFPAKQGETKLFTFTVPTSGTFTFECRDYCPAGSIIKGTLVVLLKEL